MRQQILANKHINQLDVFRGLAALSVCAVHFTYDSIFHKYFAQGLFVQLFFTLSGFENDNPLSQLGNVNIHVPSNKYNFIEMAHHIILVSIVDIFAEKLI